MTVDRVFRKQLEGKIEEISLDEEKKTKNYKIEKKKIEKIIK